MIVPVLGTAFSRVIIASMNLVMVIQGGRALGAEGLGAMSLVTLGVSMVLLLNHVVGGGGLVYLTPRFGVARLLVPGYLWALLTAAVAWMVLHRAPLAPAGYTPYVAFIALLQSVGGIHLSILFGRQRIALHNTLMAGQSVLQVFVFTYLLGQNGASLMDFVWATVAANMVTALLAGLALLKSKVVIPVLPSGAVWPALFRQGGLSQMANLLQLLNYRFAYYVIERFLGLSALGIFSVTTQLAESAWLVPKSIGGVLYSRVSNMAEAERQRSLTVVLFKVAVIIGAAWCLLLMAIPSPVYAWIFGDEITGLHRVLAWMIPGLIAMSASQVLSHYLSGTGRVVHNTIGSALGLVVTVPAALILIPRAGLSGAAMAASLAYSASMTYQLLIFLRITATRPLELLPHAGDGERIVQLWERLRFR